MDFPILIVGGGISGITAAVELAETGREVLLVEKEPYLGGNVAGFNNYFPKLCPPACGLEINFRRIRSNPLISYYTSAEVQEISGTKGEFRVTISVGARLINNRCTSCGKCTEVCPVDREGPDSYGPAKKAAYIPGGLAFPMKYTIDAEICQKEACGKCVEVCDYNAIQLDARPVEIELRAHRIIVATGWRLYDASRIENYRYAGEPDVVTNLEFEHLLATCEREHKKLTRPSDGETPKRIAFVQCAGSRDVNHLPYCSAVCCSASVKHALTLAESYPGIMAEIFYIDLRLTGRNEKLLNKAEQDDAIKLTKGKVGRIERDKNGNGLILEVEDIMAGTRRMDSFDMVVLAMGLVPNRFLPAITTNENGFYSAGQIQGIYPVASCKRPMDVASSVKDATAAALKAMHR
ncbi:MAG: CoB--CoM heterodisulfide reductase iron-sulfur subunit A family protein [Bacteroidales bacterium]|nr:CoB--CoM heterodisulfide reductase iron-sulfur subunit A family protein [Bacteroidales bacterium]